MENKSKAIIRPYAPSDREAVREICFENSTSFDESRREILLTLYCDYYIECEPQNCFVAEVNGTVAGYIFFAADRADYENAYKPYLERLNAFGGTWRRDRLAESKVLAPYGEEYPAHMHMDVRAPFRGLGIGTALVERVFETLRSLGIGGLMLCVGTKKTDARRFYERMGFSPLTQHGGDCVYGIKL